MTLLALLKLASNHMRSWMLKAAFVLEEDVPMTSTEMCNCPAILVGCPDAWTLENTLSPIHDLTS